MKIPKKPSGRKRSPFYWWRRFKSHKYLPHNASLLRKIENGDYNYPDLFEHAEWELVWMREEQEEFIKNYTGNDHRNDALYLDIERRARKRWKKLMEDALEVENRHLENLSKDLCVYFNIDRDAMKKIMEEFGGSARTLYIHLKNKKIKYAN
jgi:hypothetical protein